MRPKRPSSSKGSAARAPRLLFEDLPILFLNSSSLPGAFSGDRDGAPPCASPPAPSSGKCLSVTPRGQAAPRNHALSAPPRAPSPARPLARNDSKSPLLFDSKQSMPAPATPRTPDKARLTLAQKARMQDAHRIDAQARERGDMRGGCREQSSHQNCLDAGTFISSLRLLQKPLQTFGCSLGKCLWWSHGHLFTRIARFV